MSENQTKCILLVEDDALDRMAVERTFKEEKLPYDLEFAETIAAARERLAAGDIDLVLIDQHLPDGFGMELQSQLEGVPSIFLTGEAGVETSTAAMKAGSYDYLFKDTARDYLFLLPITIKNALQRKRDENELERYRLHLEKEVLQRTSELKAVNEKLRSEMTQREQAAAERIRANEEKARLEGQLRQAQKMEAIGQLAGGVAHDFNNMLSVILGYGETIFDRLREGDPLRNDVKEIMEAGKRSAALTRQLLAFSRRQSLQPEVLDLNALILNLEKMLSRLIGEDIKQELALSTDLACVVADPGQIEQVIMNLAINARDAMSQGGKLIIKTINIELDKTYVQNDTSAKPGKYVMMTVTDTGCGMDKETLSQIFEPFFTTKGEMEGTGLGLSTAYGIVKQSGGNIRAHSEPGQGTTFKIYFPQTDAKPGLKEKRLLEEEIRGEGIHILVVEDENALRRLIQVILSRLDFQVTLAANGGEALLLIEEKGLRPDLIITDVVMPGMSGSVLVERLRNSQPDLKVLYMSGYADNTILQHGALESSIPFIGKPFSIRALSAKVQEALRGRGGQDEPSAED